MASIEKRTRNGQVRWYARYRDPDGKPRAKVFDRKVEAENFVTGIAADVMRGRYIDPDAGRVSFKVYAEQWLVVCLRYAAVDAAIQMCADKADDEAIAVAMDEEDNAVSVHLGAAGTARSYRRQTTSNADVRSEHTRRG